MSRLKINIIANLGGQAWTSLLGLALVPAYLHFLGVEAYGLIGFFTSLQAIIGVMDMGLSTTTNREIARRAIRAELASESRNLVRTMELIYLLVGGLIGLVLIVVSGWLAREWFTIEHLSVDSVRLAVIIFGLTIALRWPVSLYMGVLRGLEQHVSLNGISAVIATLKSGGALIVIILVSPTLTAFLIWQLLIGGVEVFLFGWMAWKSLPASSGWAAFSLPLLRSIWRFAGGMSIISFMAVILKQLDKVLISRLLPLEQLGYYTTASSASMGLYLVISPMFSAVFPRFTSQVSMGDTAGLTKTFHKTAQFMSFVVGLAAGVLIFYSYDLLLLWTRSEVVASKAHFVLSILAFAGLMNAMMQVPYALQLASGLTWLALWNNLLSVIVLTPMIYLLIRFMGINGGAIAWALFNTVYYWVIPQIMHRYILPSEKRDWILKDTMPFILLSLVVMGASYLISQFFHGGLATYFWILAGIMGYIYMARFFYPPMADYLNNMAQVGRNVREYVRTYL